jgi:8-hydroxy-5-deazaflavin:NADPH oxidoreductase
MRIGIIGGSDEIGGTLANWWAEAGHEVVASAPGDVVAGLRDDGVQRAGLRETADFAEAVLFAPDWDVAHDILDEVGPALSGKPVIDATHPAAAPVVGTVGMAQLSHWSPEAHWVKAFNTLPPDVLDARRGRDPLLAEFLCTDFVDARRAAARLAQDLGLAPMYAGPSENAWVLETGPLNLREVDIKDATATLATALSAPH